MDLALHFFCSLDKRCNEKDARFALVKFGMSDVTPVIPEKSHPWIEHFLKQIR